MSTPPEMTTEQMAATIAEWARQSRQTIAEVPDYDNYGLHARRADLYDYIANRLRALAAATEEKDKELQELKVRLAHTQEWYAVRTETLSDWVRANRDKLAHEFVDQYFCIRANGTPMITGDTPPNYARLMNMLRHRAEAAESKLTELARENRELRERAGLFAKLDSVLQQDPFRLTIKWDNYQDSGVYIYDGEGKQVGHSEELGDEGDGDPEGKTLRAAINSIKIDKP